MSPLVNQSTPRKPVNCNVFSLWPFRFGADPITKSPLTQNKQMEMDIDPSLGMDLAAEGLWSDEESDHSFAASESDAEIAPPKKKVHIPIPSPLRPLSSLHFYFHPPLLLPSSVHTWLG